MQPPALHSLLLSDRAPTAEVLSSCRAANAGSAGLDRLNVIENFSNRPSIIDEKQTPKTPVPYYRSNY
jgi:hypothetical protein